MEYIITAAAISIALLALYRYWMIRKLVKEIRTELGEKELDLGIKIDEYETLSRLYNQLVDTAMDLGFIMETSSGYVWRRPEMARGCKPYLATVKGKKVNF